MIDEREAWKRVEDEAWRDEFHIAWIGASNPRAVMRTLNRHRAVMGEDHPAVRAITGHLAFLEGKSLGPSEELLGEVMEQAYRLHLV